MIEIPGRIPIRIQPLFWILIVLIGWLNSETVLGTVIWACIITVSIIFHELGHALTSIFFGQKAEIELVGFGGVTKRQGGSLKLWQEFFIVLNGPLAGFLLFFLAYLMNIWLNPQPRTLAHYVIDIAMYINLIWTVLNLLPVLPLDGAHLVRILLESLLGVKGIRLAALISLVVAFVVGILSFIYNFLIAGIFFFIMGFESYRAWDSLRGMTDEDTQSASINLFKKGEEAFNQKKFDEALPILLSVRNQLGQGKIFNAATQYAAHIYADQGNLEETYRLLSSIQKDLTPDYIYLLVQVAFRLGKYDEAIQLGEQAFKENPIPEIALINALSCASLGRVRPAIEWLKGSIQSGLEDIPKILHRKEFNPIRLSPEFQAFLNNYT